MDTLLTREQLCKLGDDVKNMSTLSLGVLLNKNFAQQKTVHDKTFTRRFSERVKIFIHHTTRWDKRKWNDTYPF